MSNLTRLVERNGGLPTLVGRGHRPLPSDFDTTPVARIG